MRSRIDAHVRERFGAHGLVVDGDLRVREAAAREMQRQVRDLGLEDADALLGSTHDVGVARVRRPEAHGGRVRVDGARELSEPLVGRADAEADGDGVLDRLDALVLLERGGEVLLVLVGEGLREELASGREVLRALGGSRGSGEKTDRDQRDREDGSRVGHSAARVHKSPMTDERRDATEVNRGLDRPLTNAVPRVTAVSGPGSGRAVALVRATATAGRHATNDLVLDDPRVSGVHLELLREGDRVRVRDAGSTNGTWLGPYRVTDIELTAGAELKVGDTVLRVDTDDSAAPAAVSANESFGALVGRSTAMREIFATLDRVAKKHIAILFQGEPGTGKEEMARAIVAQSPRADRPFVVVDVPSLPPAMIETLLFGEEKAGSEPVRGLVEAGNGGTVFFDEIGQLPLPVQAKLLRVVERGELTRVGGHVAVKVDVRVLATTTRDLRHDIETQRFREDLYFRLAQVRVFVPALRDRIEDIPMLCRRLLEQVGHGASLTIEDDAIAYLSTNPWPGNVRELRNTLERAFALCRDNVIKKGDVAGEGSGFRGNRDERAALDVSGTFKDAKDRAVERFEAAYLATLMRRCNGNVSLAAREADLARHHLRDLLKKRALYGIDWEKSGGD